MKRLLTVVAALFLLGTLALPAFAGDTLDEVKKKGVLVVGVKDSTPPLGAVDHRSGEIVGYDFDIAADEKRRSGERNEFERQKFQQKSQPDWYYYRRY